jgi:hypothetical protein
MKTVDLIDEVASLPVEERARVVDTLLRSLNTPESVVDSAWMEVAQRRPDECAPARWTPSPAKRFSSVSTSATENELCLSPARGRPWL